MKISLVAALTVTAFLAVSCSRDEPSERSSASYEVISEGAASGVASTIGDAGEPLTSTNVDTTTAFTIVPPQPGLTTTDSTGTSLASELPSPDGSLSGAPGGVSRPASPSGTISIAPSRPASPSPSAPTRPAPPATAPPPTSTAAPDEPEQPAEERPEEPPEEDDEGGESDPTTTSPTTAPGDGSGTTSLHLS